MKGNLLLLFAVAWTLGNALMIKHFPQEESLSSVDPPTPASTTTILGEESTSAPEAPISSTTEFAPGATPPTTTPGSFDFSVCSGCDGLLDLVDQKVCSSTIDASASECVVLCGLDGIQEAVDAIVAAYYQTCADSGTCLPRSDFALIPQSCRDLNGLISEDNIYGWDRSKVCTGGDQNDEPKSVEGGRPTACINGSGGAPDSLNCVATQCNAFLVKASPTYPNPCEPDIASLARACTSCGGPTIHIAGDVDTFVIALNDWCIQAPRCFDILGNVVKTDGACASALPPGGSDTTSTQPGEPVTTNQPVIISVATEDISSPSPPISSVDQISTSITEPSDPSAVTSVTDGAPTPLPSTTSTVDPASPEGSAISGVAVTLSETASAATLSTADAADSGSISGATDTVPTATATDFLSPSESLSPSETVDTQSLSSSNAFSSDTLSSFEIISSLSSSETTNLNSPSETADTPSESKASSAQISVLPNGSTLTIPPTTSATGATVGGSRPTPSGESINASGTRQVNTAFASATTTSSAGGKRVARVGAGLLSIAAAVIILL